tara:strand:+ start:298 stop:897 length:600 start_codon:yes stop_codon:yes gene_type:complete
MKVVAKEVFKGDAPNIAVWDRPTVRIFNGKIVHGRPTKGYGTSEFNYAGRLYKPQPWTVSMKHIKNKAEKWASDVMGKPIKFTFCLCGLYETGDACVPHHSDTVPTLDDVVLGISFGGSRVFEWAEYLYDVKSKTDTSKTHNLHQLTNDGNPPAESSLFLLEDGDVYMFDGRSQMTSTHAVPPLIGAQQRISLTFRSGI